VDLRSTLPRTATVLRQVVGLIGRDFRGPRTTSPLLEADDRSYQLLRPASAPQRDLAAAGRLADQAGCGGRFAE
jgi:hypothetical protein